MLKGILWNAAKELCNVMENPLGIFGVKPPIWMFLMYLNERFKGWKFGNEVEIMLGDERIHPSIHPLSPPPPPNIPLVHLSLSSSAADAPKFQSLALLGSSPRPPSSLIPPQHLQSKNFLIDRTVEFCKSIIILLFGGKD
jgi:hypothetical protein